MLVLDCLLAVQIVSVAVPLWRKWWTPRPGARPWPLRARRAH